MKHSSFSIHEGTFRWNSVSLCSSGGRSILAGSSLLLPLPASFHCSLCARLECGFPFLFFCTGTLVIPYHPSLPPVLAPFSAGSSFGERALASLSVDKFFRSPFSLKFLFHNTHILSLSLARASPLIFDFLTHVLWGAPGGGVWASDLDSPWASNVSRSTFSENSLEDTSTFGTLSNLHFLQSTFHLSGLFCLLLPLFLFLGVAGDFLSAFTVRVIPLSQPQSKVEVVPLRWTISVEKQEACTFLR